MSNDVRNIEDFETVVKDLKEVLAILDAEETGIVTRMKRHKMTGVETHMSDVLNKHMPALTKWAFKLKGTFDLQERAHNSAKADKAKAAKKQ